MKFPLLLSTISALLVLVSAEPAPGQQDPAPPPLAVAAEAPVAMQGQVMVWQAAPNAIVGDAEQLAERVEAVVRSEVATAKGDVRRVCKLSEQQQADLETAAKGVIELTLQQWREQQEQQQPEAAPEFQQAPVLPAAPILQVAPALPALPLLPAAPVLPPAAPEAEQAPALEDALPPPEPPVAAVAPPLAMAPQVIVLQQNAFPGGWQDPWNPAWNQASDAWRGIYHELWQKVLSRILTDEQQELHRASVAERVAFRRRAAVSTITVRIDEQLRLSEPQRRQVIEVLDRMIGKQLEHGMVEPVPHFISPDAFQEILDDSQRARWKDWQNGLVGDTARVVFPPPVPPGAGDVFFEGEVPQ